MNDRYCKLYVDSDLSPSDLLALVANSSRGRSGFRWVDCDWGAIDIHRNDEYSIFKKHGADGFLFYRYIIDIEPNPADISQDEYVRGIKDLVAALRNSGAKVTAACDFEVLLGDE